MAQVEKDIIWQRVDLQLITSGCDTSVSPASFMLATSSVAETSLVDSSELVLTTCTRLTFAPGLTRFVMAPIRSRSCWTVWGGWTPEQALSKLL